MSSSARDRLIEAALALIGEKGPRGASTRAIAERAGLNEVTLFRTFGRKDDLIAACIQSLFQRIVGPTGQRPRSDDVVADLEALARDYFGLANSHRHALARLLPELRRNQKLAEAILRDTATPVTASMFGLFAHHQGAGRLRSDADPRELTLAFLGPLLAHAMIGDLLGLPDALDLPAYVARYLDGHRG